MTAWPENKNPILEIFRENFDDGDKWGSTINFLFALCDIAMVYGVTIPTELQFSPSPFGPDSDAPSYKDLEGLMEDGYYIHEPLSLEELQKHVSHALKVLNKYDSILRLNGESY